jgi:hypothetical protein
MAQVTIDNHLIYDFSKNDKRYWKVPPDLYAVLNNEFGFDFDPCPWPKEFDSLNMEWGTSNFVNPPFVQYNGVGPTAFVRKAIEENQKGKTVVLTLPTRHYINLLLEAGAEARSLGRVRWIEVNTNEPMPSPNPVTCFILRGKNEG